MNFLYYKGRLYISEATVTTSNQAALHARKIVNAIMSNDNYDPEVSKDDIRLLNYTIANFDLWHVIIEYFSGFANTINSKDNLNSIGELQKKIAYNIDKVGNIIANEYGIAKSKLKPGSQLQTQYNASNNDTYRKVTYTYRLYLYTVALYNLRYIEYLNSMIDSGILFSKKFNVNLENTYDPPRMEYIDNMFLNPSSKSDFNQSISMSDWSDELADKTVVISSGFYNASSWNFDKIKDIYNNGFIESDKLGNIDFVVEFKNNSNARQNIDFISDAIDTIISEVKDNIVELKPNLIKSSIKNSVVSSNSIENDKNKINDNLKTITAPYSKPEDIRNQIKSKTDLDKAKNITKDVSKIISDEKSIKNKTKKAVGSAATSIGNGLSGAAKSVKGKIF